MTEKLASNEPTIKPRKRVVFDDLTEDEANTLRLILTEDQSSLADRMKIQDMPIREQ